jgi:antirestriction protein
MERRDEREMERRKETGNNNITIDCTRVHVFLSQCTNENSGIKELVNRERDIERLCEERWRERWR